MLGNHPDRKGEFVIKIADKKLLIFIGEECLKDILQHLGDLDHTWFYLGISLGVPYDALKNIESNEREVE